MKGLIICGYPGIGKSSIRGWNNCIDLESSYFSHDDCGEVIDDWVERYCKTALAIARQGYTVLVSCHEPVRNCLYNQQKDYNKSWYTPKVPVVIFCPRPEMKEAWAIRLVERYLKTNRDKDLRAFEGSIRSWETNMKYMKTPDFPIYSPDEIDYDLRDYILKIRKREGCDDEETDSPMEQVAGVEESSLDVPMVEENSDSVRSHSE